MFDIYPRLPVFIKKRLFVNRYVAERIGLSTTEANLLANEALMDMLFQWHNEQFRRHEQFEEMALYRDLEPAEMEQDNLTVAMMSFLEDAAAFVASREHGTMPVGTLRSYLEAKLILSTDILEGEVPHFALDHIVSKLRRIEEVSVKLG